MKTLMENKNDVQIVAVASEHNTIDPLANEFTAMVSFAFDVQELTSENRICQDDISLLLKWLEKEDSVPKISDKQIATFLIACDNKLDKVKKCILQYYLTRRNAPQIFNNRDVSKEEMVQQLKSLQFAIIPKRTSDNYAIIINRLSDPNPCLYHMDTAMKLLFMCYDSLLYDNPPDGVIVLFDMDQTSLRFITRTKLSTVKIASCYVQECMPVKLKEVHVMNVVWFFNKFLGVIKPFMNKELMKKLYLHLPNDLENFYEKHVPKSHLPKDYGGELPPINELHEQTIRRLTSLTKYFEEEENQRKEFDNSKK